MKKVIKVTGIVILVLFMLIFTIPFAFQGKIMDIAKVQINNNLNAKADFKKLSLSLLRNFPNVSAGIKDLYIAGIGDFEGDTLFSVSSVEVVVDVISAIKMENIRVKKIIIDNPRIHAWVLPDGSVNWDITKESDADTEQEEDTTSGNLNPQIELKRFEINHAYISYEDDSSNLSASLNDFNFALSGDLSKDYTTLALQSETKFVNVIMGGIRYLKDVALNLNMNVDADLENSKFTLEENSIALNDLVLRLNGSAEMPNEEDILIDLTYGLDKADFKSLLSLIPTIYMKEFEGVQTSGQLQLDGTIKGTYNKSVIPDVALTLLVEDAMFKYPVLPKSADNINIDVNLFFDGVQNDNTTVDVNRFHVELGDNPVDMTLNIKTPVSDMFVNGSLSMDLDLESLSDVVPLDNTTLTGDIKAALDFMGYLSYIESEQYDKFKADGSVQISNFNYSSPDIPRDINIQESLLAFSPQYLDVRSFNAIMGKSDLKLSGKIEDFLPYVFKDETIKGDFVFTSGTLDLNEFMTEEKESAAAETDSVPLKVIEVPGNIDFKLISRIDNLYYDKMEITNTVGTILVKNSRVILDGLRMNMLSGTMQLSGEYNTVDTKSPMVDFDFNATTIDIAEAVASFSVLEKFAPIARKAVGKVSLDMKYTSYLSESMMPVLNSIVGSGNFVSDLIAIKSSTTFDKIGDALKTNAFDNMSLKQVDVGFDIRDGRLMVEPFETKMGNTTFLIGGDQGLDKSMNYTVGINIPRSELGAAANAPIDDLIGKAEGLGINVDPLENLNFKIKVGGTFSDPTIGIDMGNNSGSATQALKEEVKQTVQEQIDTKKEEARAAAQEEVDKLIAEAEKEAALIREKAAAAADAVRKEADINADRLVDQANDPISKRLAEEGAKKLRQEGEASAQKIIDEADAKADAIINAAREKGDKLLNP